MDREEERLKEVKKMLSIDERKRAYNVMYDDRKLTEEEIEAYQRKRLREDDPMLQMFKDWDTSVHVSTHDANLLQPFQQQASDRIGMILR